MKVALCCIGRMENRYSKEYVEYYKNIGVDKIFIYDNNYDGEEHFEDVIGDYISDGFVDVINYRNKKSCQLSAYQDCYDNYSNEYDWICYFDFDEFIEMNGFEDIKDFLGQNKFNEFEMIHINWKCYDDNDNVLYEDKPVRERFTRVKLPLDFLKGYNFPENNHIKPIVRGGLTGVVWNATPHTPRGVKKCCDAGGNECNPDSPFNTYNFEYAWLCHYITKSIQEWVDIKTKRGYPDNNTIFLNRNNILKEFFKVNKMTSEKRDFLLNNGFRTKFIVSMTTIIGRKERLLENLPSILSQSFNFDKLIINVDDDMSDNDYMFYESLKKIDQRIEINKSDKKWRSCNKLLPSIRKYPDDVIITVDDDIYYPVDSIKFLVDKWVENKDCIITHEINPIFIKDNFIGYNNAYDVMLEQREWGKYFSNCCLFPPHCFDGSDLFDYDKMLECTKGLHDELWFWVNSTINGIQCIGLNYIYSFAPETKTPYKDDEYQLTNYNKENDNITDYMVRINERYGERLLKSINSKPTLFKLTRNNVNLFLVLYERIKRTYDYGFNVNINSLTKAWQNKVKSIIRVKNG